VYSAGIFKQSMGARNRVGIVLSYRPASAGIFKQPLGARNRVGVGLSYRLARLHRAGGIDSMESIPGLFKSSKIRAQQSTWAGKIDSLESILGLLKRLKIRAQAT
jgi:hypothetical protein